jgi:hypothetical protein
MQWRLKKKNQDIYVDIQLGDLAEVPVPLNLMAIADKNRKKKERERNSNNTSEDQRRAGM